MKEKATNKNDIAIEKTNKEIKNDNKIKNEKTEISSEKLDTIKKEIKKNKKEKKISENQKQARRKAMMNIVIAFFIIIYYRLNLLASYRLSALTFLNDLKTFIIFQLIMGIVLIESSYRIKSRTLAFGAFELIANAGMTLIMNYVYIMNFETLHIYIACITGAFTIYYIIKSIILVKINKWN